MRDRGRDELDRRGHTCAAEDEDGCRPDLRR